MMFTTHDDGHALFQEGKRPAGPTEAGFNPINLAKFHEIPDRNGMIPTYY